MTGILPYILLVDMADIQVNTDDTAMSSAAAEDTTARKSRKRIAVAPDRPIKAAAA